MTPPMIDRPAQAWRASGREQRLAALAAFGLFISMLLPWYSKTNTVVVGDAARATQQSLSAFQSFSFVEAAVLLVSAGVLAMLFARGERRDFHLPGGDGTIVMIAGGWTALLIFYRLLDKPGLQGNQRITATVGVEWGIFIALLLALGLAYAGTRMRAQEHAQPPAARPAARRQGHQAEDEGERAERRRASRPTPMQPEEDSIGDEADELEEEVTTISPAPGLGRRPPPAPARATSSTQSPSGPAPRPASDRRGARGRSRYPPAPAEQMSFEEEPPRGQQRR